MQREDARFIIGIDLGTTTCSLSYIDLFSTSGTPVDLSLVQESSEGVLIEETLLPSWLFLPVGAKAPQEWQEGEFAKTQGSTLPGRAIHSAKSWLIHPGEKALDAILPWGSEEVSSSLKISPIEASTRYLAFLKRAWERHIHDQGIKASFDDQEVIIGIPASFGEAAQAYTYEAAKNAGYPSTVSLIEEPLAAFYAFLHEKEQFLTSHPKLLKRPLQILICDVGGGTTDFTLCEVTEDGRYVRKKVGRHLLLGGDNFDHALVREIERKREKELSLKQYNLALHAVREIKEKALNNPSFPTDESHTIILPGEGSKLFGNTEKFIFSDEELQEIFLEGFFPWCKKEDVPKERSTLFSAGLPYAVDPAITRHLAAFIEDESIDAVLYSGGALIPPLFRSRISAVIGRWQEHTPVELPAPHLRLAVARGGALSKYTSRKGRRIEGGTPYALYLELGGVQHSALLCILPKGAESGSAFSYAERAFTATLNTRVRFDLYARRSGIPDTAGEIVPFDGLLDKRLFEKVASLSAYLEASGVKAKESTVIIESMLSEGGILSLKLREKEHGEQQWNLSFFLREETKKGPSHSASSVPHEITTKLQQEILLFFGGSSPQKPSYEIKKLPSILEKTARVSKERWELSLLRALWDPLAKGITKRSRSLDHELVWLQLAGYSLRPGFGEPLDDLRMHEAWRLIDLGLHFKKEERAQVQWWIFWRRISGGLSRERQEILFQSAKGSLFHTPEMLKAVASLQRIRKEWKVTLLKNLIDFIEDKPHQVREPHGFALLRLLSRRPLIGTASDILPYADIAPFLHRLLSLNWKEKNFLSLLPAMSSLFLQTDERTVEVPLELQQQIRRIIPFQLIGSSEKKEKDITSSNAAAYLGDSLPLGLQLTSLHENIHE